MRPCEEPTSDVLVLVSSVKYLLCNPNEFWETFTSAGRGGEKLFRVSLQVHPPSNDHWWWWFFFPLIHRRIFQTSLIQTARSRRWRFFFFFFLHKGPRLNRRSRDLMSSLRSLFSVGANFSFTTRSLYLRRSFARQHVVVARCPRATGATSDWGGVHTAARVWERVGIKRAFLIWRVMSGRTVTKSLVSQRKRTRRLNADAHGEVVCHTTRLSLSSRWAPQLIKTPNEFCRGQKGQESWAKATLWHLRCKVTTYL